jgi:AcrR family transcriptional regulator
MKDPKVQKLMPRKPRQQRAQVKVELILEAAMRLLAKGGLAALTTNAVAETAGVSIGTLYQYFANKEAILDALAERETAELSERVLAALTAPGEIPPDARIAAIIGAVASGYGGRQQVHRLVMEHSLHRGAGRLGPLLEQLVAFLTSYGPPDGDGRDPPFSHAEAFVLTNAFAGVMRAMILGEGMAVPAQKEIEAALARMIIAFARG